MKKLFRYIAAVVFATSMFSCAELEDVNGGLDKPEAGEKIKLILNVEKGAVKSSDDTKIYVGQTSGGTVKYYWNENDQIGVIPLDVASSAQNVKPNYVTAESQINPSNKNQAQFESYLQTDGYTTSEPNLLIYYPYNSSMLEGISGSTGQDYAKSGLTFRLPQQQEQYGYSKTFVGENDSEANEHPSVWAISRYGLAYDLAGSTQVKEEIDGVTVSNLRGDFTLEHANTYFQFNVYGSKSDGVNSKDYADGTWKVASLSLEAGHCEQVTDPETNEPVFVMSDQVNIAGTYKFTYTYDANHFTDGAALGVANNDKITLSPVVAVNSVKVSMNNLDSAPALKGTAKDFVPAFAVINGLDIKKNPKGNLNCLKVSVTCYKYEDGSIVGSDTRTRFYNIAGANGIVGNDISGNYYTINFEVCDPVESYTDLSALNSANCYVISAPGNYTFKADIAGNGRLPHGTTGSEVMGIDPKNLMQDGKKYAIDWLWASGTSFDEAAKTGGNDSQIVSKIVNNVGLTGDKGEVSIGLAAGSTLQTLSGNVVLALYEVNSDGSAGDIVWTWHLWLGMPEARHFRFPATSDAYMFTNEDWIMLDRNVGAETNELGNVRSTGLFYQRGRKEPMIGFGDIQGSTTWTSNQIHTYRNTIVFGTRANWTANVKYSNYNTLSEPMSLIASIDYDTSSPYYYAWNSASEVSETSIANDTKSMFDPCPVGYRLPTTREWDNFKNVEFTDVSGNELASGVFGYCFLKELEDVLKTTNATDKIIAERIAAGNYYVVNDQFERTYYISEHSGTGSPLTINFPNSGVLYADGTMEYLYETEDKTETVKKTIYAPEFTMTTTTVNKTKYFSFDFVDDNGTYSYATSSTSTRRTNISNSRISVSSVSFSNDKATLYVYSTEDDVLSNYTSVTITRSGSSNNYSYTYQYNVGDPKESTVTTTIKGTEAALAMWSAGRVEASKYEFFWFGPMRGRIDPWKSGTTPSYKSSETRKHYDIGYAPYGLWGVQDKPEGASATNASRGAASVARCIREYDNSSIVTVAE